jgi:hypothetical protein
VALGIELKPFNFDTCMVESILIRRPANGSRASSPGIDLRQATLSVTFGGVPMRPTAALIAP